MSYKIQVLPWCVRQLKKLSKKYPQIKKDLEEVSKIIVNNPEMGDKITGMNVPLYKIRMRSSDQKRGKRGGYRVIYYLKSKNGIIYLVDIYAKVERAEINRAEILKILEEEGLF